MITLLKKWYRKIVFKILRVDIEEVCLGLGTQAELFWRQGDLESAERLLIEAESLSRDANLQSTLAKLIGTRALVKCHKGELNLALKLHVEEEKLFRQFGDNRGLGVSLGNQAVILKDVGNRTYSLALLKEQEQLCRRIGDAGLLAMCLGNQGGILLSRGELRQATLVFAEVERLCRELSDLDGFAKTFLNQARIHGKLGEITKAEELCAKSEAIFRGIASPAGVVEANMVHAQVLVQDPKRARQFANEADRLAKMYGLGLMQGKVRRVIGELSNEKGAVVVEFTSESQEEEKARALYTEWCESAAAWFGPRPAFEPEGVNVEAAHERLKAVASESTKINDRLYVCPSPWHAVLVLLTLQDRSLSQLRSQRQSMVFRGQGDYRWPLISSIDRDGVDRETEQRACVLFSEVMARFFEKHESTFDSDFAPDHPEVYTAAAQHYGIKTGLLDFTTDAAAAVAFANDSGPPGTIASVFAIPYHAGAERGLHVILPHPYFTRLFIQRGLFVDTRESGDLGLMKALCIEVRFPKWAGFRVYRNGAPVNLVPSEPSFEKLIGHIRSCVQKGLKQLDEDSCDKLLEMSGVFQTSATRTARSKVILESFFELWQMVYTLAIVHGPGGQNSVDAVSLRALSRGNRSLLKELVHVYRLGVQVLQLEESNSLLGEALDALVNKEPMFRLLDLLGRVGKERQRRVPRRYDRGGKWQLVYGVTDSALGEVVAEFQNNGAAVEVTRHEDGSWLVFATRLEAEAGPQKGI